MLPSCEKCNRPNNDKVTGARRGKANKFPLKNAHQFLVKLSATEKGNLKSDTIESSKFPGYFYLGPQDLDDREERLLLHPYFDEPRKHLKFGAKGMVVAREGSAQGEESIRVYGLEEPGLIRARHKRQLDSLNTYLTAYTHNAVNEELEENEAISKAWKAVWKRSTEYFAAVEDYIKSRQVV